MSFWLSKKRININFISLKLIQNYALFEPFHNETQNNSNIGKKNSNKQSDTFAKGKQNCAGN